MRRKHPDEPLHRVIVIAAYVLVLCGVTKGLVGGDTFTIFVSALSGLLALLWVVDQYE